MTNSELTHVYGKKLASDLEKLQIADQILAAMHITNFRASTDGLSRPHVQEAFIQQSTEHPNLDWDRKSDDAAELGRYVLAALRPLMDDDDISATPHGRLPGDEKNRVARNP